MAKDYLLKRNYMIVEDSYFSAVQIIDMMKELKPEMGLATVLDEISDLPQALADFNVSLVISEMNASDGNVVIMMEKLQPEVPTIYLTEYAADRALLARSHCVDVIVKPITKSALTAALGAFEEKFT